MFIDTADMISAGQITADSQTQYYVVYAQDHPTLKTDDVVVMAETPRQDNVFIRLCDMTIHTLQTDAGYVIVAQRFKQR